MVAPADEKRWYHRPLQNTLIGVLAAAALGYAGSQLAKDTPAPPGPSSERASILLDQAPCVFSGYQLKISGSGWDGDSKVEIRMSEEGTPDEDTFPLAVLVADGRFSFTEELSAEWVGPLNSYTITVRGTLTGKILKTSFSTPSAGC